MASYTPGFLRGIRLLSHVFYKPFTINVATRLRIIALGIRRQPINKQYHRCQAGRDLFHRNSSVQSRQKLNKEQGYKDDKHVKLSNLISPSISNDGLINATFSVVNARSIYNKLHSFPELQSRQKTQQYVLLLKHGLVMTIMTLDIKKSHHLDTKSCPDFGKMEREGVALQWYTRSHST